MSMEVIAAGLLTTVQDSGRKGMGRFGISPCGAADPIAFRIANLLVGNGEERAALEATIAGPSLLFGDRTLIALCGADMSATLNGNPLPLWRPVVVEKGSLLEFGELRRGCRLYVALAGGFDLPKALGSRSTDIRAGIGGQDGRPLRAGDVLQCEAYDDGTQGHPVAFRWKEAFHYRTTSWYVDAGALPYRRSGLLRLIAGPEFDLLSRQSKDALISERFHVAPQSDRMGIRLEGTQISLASPLEMISEGVTTGTLQLPPDGLPILLLADRQTVGGYPRIATITSADIPIAAQLRPGDAIRFELITMETGQQLYLQQQQDLTRLKRSISLMTQ